MSLRDQALELVGGNTAVRNAQIYAQAKSGMPRKEIAARWGVTYNRVHQIVWTQAVRERRRLGLGFIPDIGLWAWIRQTANLQTGAVCSEAGPREGAAAALPSEAAPSAPLRPGPTGDEQAVERVTRDDAPVTGAPLPDKRHAPRPVAGPNRGIAVRQQQPGLTDGRAEDDRGLEKPSSRAPRFARAGRARQPMKVAEHGALEASSRTMTSRIQTLRASIEPHLKLFSADFQSLIAELIKLAEVGERAQAFITSFSAKGVEVRGAELTRKTKPGSAKRKKTAPPKRSVAASARAPKASSLRAAILSALSTAGKPLSLTEIESAVKAQGHTSKSANFAKVLSLTISKMSTQLKRVDRGVYRLA